MKSYDGLKGLDWGRNERPHSKRYELHTSFEQKGISLDSLLYQKEIPIVVVSADSGLAETCHEEMSFREDGTFSRVESGQV